MLVLALEVASSPHVLFLQALSDRRQYVLGLPPITPIHRFSASHMHATRFQSTPKAEQVEATQSSAELKCLS